MKTIDKVFIAWVVCTSVLALVLFGWDKFRASDGDSRISEFHLALAGAIGGWPGGLFGMLIFRHKTAKLTFQLKYFIALLAWGGLIYLWWHYRDHV